MTEETGKLARMFRDRFKHALKQDTDLFRLALMTDRLYDARKLFGFFEESGLAPDPTPVRPLQDAAAATEILSGPAEVTFPPAEPVDHYALKRTSFRRPPLRAFRLRQVYLSYDSRNHGAPEFYFFDREGALINGLFYGGAPFLETPQAEIGGISVFADDSFTTFNICHLLFDKLARAHLAAGHFGARQALFLSRAEYTAALAAELGLAAVMPPAGRPRRGTLALEECIVFDNSFVTVCHPGRFGDAPALAALGALRARILARGPLEETPGKYLIVRPEGAARAAVNAGAVAGIFARHGFAAGDPARLAPLDQLRLFAGVTHLAGVHGAGLAHLAVMPEGGTVLELLPPLAATNAYWMMAAARGLGYRHLVCEDPEAGAVDARDRTHQGRRHNRRAVRVPEAALDALLAGSG